MSVFKCKMCGGSLSVQDGATVAECEYCGTTQTVPTSNDEVIVNLFNRANNLRLKGDFDKALEVYEKILDLDNTQAEAHWGVVLCKYGVEYVEDPLTKERIPTCHRTQVESILTDTDYQAVLQYADSVSRAVYEEQAAAINGLQKKILEIVKSEKPFDVFICYKETDESGARTKDSVIANEIYHELTNSGLKVFFAAITLENKLGQEYEPYIFAALTSAKVMLVLGTKPEYFNAVWVKNEWSRYLHLMRADPKTKRTLIPCYRDMDAYDLPDEFSHLQALDMANIAFLPDLTRNLSKLISHKSKIVSDDEEPENDITPLLKRAFLFIEDGEYDRADKLLEEVLNRHPENAKAYVGKVLISHKLHTEADLEFESLSIVEESNFKRAYKYADDDYRKTVLSKPCESAYQHALMMKNQAQYEEAEKEFLSLLSYKDSEKQAEECRDLILQAVYDSAVELMQMGEFRKAGGIFSSISSYKDSKEKVDECQNLREEKSRIEAEKRRELRKKEDEERELRIKAEREKKRRAILIGVPTVLGVIAIICAAVFIIGYLDEHRPGTEDNPILISTAEDLMRINSFSEEINDYYTKNDRYNYYVLTNDIDLTGYDWIPLGMKNYREGNKGIFHGSIDGNGYTIHNMHIDATVLPEKWVPVGFVWAMSESAVIKNLNFENVHITGTKENQLVGVIVAYCYGTISGCSVSGISYQSKGECGGLVYSLTDGTLTSCHVSGNIDGNVPGVACEVRRLNHDPVITDCTFMGVSVNK
ncbi:MAG: TIR domain-containing protein [Methanocorpusculum sp.]|nr:TIR domain-containing protein [Oscillospiraceae bacterium]MBQ3571182.1 TIR domain-containing protein [Methanocorpusculum sp.]